jgi:methionyl-tRNA formyltransferase
VAQPRSLRLDGKYPIEAAAAQALLQAAQADVMVVVAYGLILPQWVLDVPRHGCLNIHASLLPRWRGAAPIHRAIEAGDTETGVAIMQMDAGLDTGDMLLVESLPIARTDTTGSLHDKLADLGGTMVVQALAQLDTLVPVPQPTDGITYAHKIEKREAAIDWTQSADTIVRRIRAFNPFPGAATQLGGESLKVWSATVADAPLPAGTVCGSIVAVAPEYMAVAAMNSIVNITQVQRPGGKRLAVADFLRGCPVQPGMVCESLA